MTGTTRDQFIAALRDLADYLTAHPSVPAPDYGTCFNVFPDDGTDAEQRAWVDQFAALTGTTPAESARGHYTATKEFGPIKYAAVAISEAARAAHDAERSYRGSITPDLPDAA
jgi:hypothetical protein